MSFLKIRLPSLFLVGALASSIAVACSKNAGQAQVDQNNQRGSQIGSHGQHQQR